MQEFLDDFSSSLEKSRKFNNGQFEEIPKVHVGLEGVEDDQVRKSEVEVEEIPEVEVREVEVDWKLEEGHINSYRLTDAEVEEALKLLELAKLWVISNPTKVTQRIRLISVDGSVLHVVRIRAGLPDTKDIRASSDLPHLSDLSDLPNRIGPISQTITKKYENMQLWQIILDLLLRLLPAFIKSLF